MKSKRFEVLANRPVNQDGYVKEWPEVGLIAMNSPFDPTPSIKIENGRVTELDGYFYCRPCNPFGKCRKGYGVGFIGNRAQDCRYQCFT